MTYNEIIKALECLTGEEVFCNGCVCHALPFPVCRTVIAKHSLDLINRQKAEIERYEKENTVLVESNHILATEYAKKAKAEAIKEFAERLCADRVSNDPVVIAAKCALKEMTE